MISSASGALLLTAPPSPTSTRLARNANLPHSAVASNVRKCEISDERMALLPVLWMPMSRDPIQKNDAQT